MSCPDQVQPIEGNVNLLASPAPKKVEPTRQASLTWILELPPEIIVKILDYWMGKPTLRTSHPDTPGVLCPHFASEVDPSVLPPTLRIEHKRLLRKKWLHDEKEFDNLIDFVAIHKAILPRYGIIPEKKFPRHFLGLIFQPSGSRGCLPYALRPHGDSRLYGLEKIRLNLTVEDFCILFRVELPPFGIPNFRLADGNRRWFNCMFACLKHTKSLVLTFGSRYKETHLWYNLDRPEWQNEGADGIVPSLRPNVCTSGQIIDWIMTFAWYTKSLQHLSEVTIDGDVQPWVVEKWSKVLGGTHPDLGTIGTKGDITRITSIGLQDATLANQPWVISKHYPPTCSCQIACERLVGGEIKPPTEAYDIEWDTKYEGKVEGDWFNPSKEPQGNW